MHSDWREYRRLKPFLVPYASRLGVILGINVISTLLGLAQPYISKLLIDNALVPRDMHALLWVAGLMFGATVLGFLLNILSSYQYVRVSASMLFDMRLALYRHLQTLSPRFYAKWRLGDLVSRLNNDIGEVQRVSADTLLSVLSNVVFLAGSVAMMLLLNWRLFLFSAIFVPVSIATFRRYQRRLITLTRDLRERGADLGSLFVDTLLGMRTVVTSNAGEREAEKFRERNGAFVSTLLRLQVTSFLSGALPGTILTAATAGVFLLGGWMIIHGTMKIGTLVAFMAYHMRLLNPVQTMMGLAQNLASARVSLGRIFEILDTAPEVTEHPNALALQAVRGDIRFDNVTLRHDRAEVLSGVSFTIRAGTFCAILGPSGVGKSTVADLLVRLLDPDFGAVSLDGHDVRDLRIKDLRDHIVLVDQSPYMFNATIAENIAYARPDATRADIEAAGAASGLDELIHRLPEGYETKAGERGLALSAGERQRIAIARALLARPSVLVLDEPTSALDADTEKIVARNLREHLRDSTVIVITHRPALAEIAGQIITLREGKVWLETASASQ
jgi:ATP-binding cassette, subfamily B, bacterial